MSRTWFYQKLMANSALVAALPGGIHVSTGLHRAPDTKPFAVYRTIAHRPELRGDDDDQVAYETYLVFVHDNPGSYDKIDAVLLLLQRMFQHFMSDGQVISVTWMENSEDFRDEDMGTILRYSRIRCYYRVVLVP